MLRTFGDRESERTFNRLRSRKYSLGVQRAALRKLLVLDAAESLSDLRSPPGNRLEKLSGKRAGHHSIRINDQWRICFRWDRGNAYEVEVTDYH